MKILPKTTTKKEIFWDTLYRQALGPVSCPGHGPSQGPGQGPVSSPGSGLNSELKIDCQILKRKDMERHYNQTN